MHKNICKTHILHVSKLDPSSHSEVLILLNLAIGETAIWTDPYGLSLFACTGWNEWSVLFFFVSICPPRRMQNLLTSSSTSNPLSVSFWIIPPLMPCFQVDSRSSTVGLRMGGGREFLSSSFTHSAPQQKACYRLPFILKLHYTDQRSVWHEKTSCWWLQT